MTISSTLAARDVAEVEFPYSDIPRQMTKRNAEQTLKVEIDDEAFDRLYGFRSHPIPLKKGQRFTVRVVSQFGEESTKVLTLF